MQKRTLSLAVLMLLTNQVSLADQLDPIIVTATRTAQTADQSLASVSIISREDIERQQARSVQDLLRGVLGLNISNNGGLGKTTSFFLRGTESDHLLVLVDGIKIGSATLGTTAFQDIPVEQIERIEIVRGPRSSLYGSEAIGGVIQIFTRKGGGDVKPFFSIGVGSQHTYQATAGLSGGGKQGWFNLSASGLDSKGFNTCNGKPFPNGAGCFTVEPDSDGYRNVASSLRAGYRFDNELEIDAHILNSNGDAQFDGDFVNEADTKQQVFGGSLRYAPLEAWSFSLTAGRSLDEADNFKDGAWTSRFNSQRDSVSWLNEVFLGDDHLLSLGVDYQQDKIDSNTAFVIDSRDNTGLFAQYQGQFSDYDLQFSVRQDDNQQFGKHSTGGIALAYAISKDLRLSGSYGTAFKAPTFNELYFPDFGNPLLAPETARSVEIGLKGNSQWGTWAINAYQTQIEELISFDAVSFAPANIDQAHIRGVEINLNTELQGWQVNTNITVMKAENRGIGFNQGNQLPRRAQQSVRVDADRAFGKYRVGASVFAEGHRYDDLGNTRRLGGYATMDLRAEYTLAKAWRVQMRVNNILDKQYETAAYFNQAGRNLFLTLRYQP